MAVWGLAASIISPQAAICSAKENCRVASACVTSSSSVGSRPGAHGSGSAPTSSSKRVDSNDVPETPSTMQWCDFDTSAQRPSASPSIIHSSHSGFSRSRAWASTRAPSSLSSLSPPGDGTAVRRRWNPRSKCG